jgi:hypothetical protein
VTGKACLGFIGRSFAPRDNPENNMKMVSRKRVARIIAVWMLTAACVAAAAFAQAQGTQITVTGEINDTYQLVANGKVYDIAETPSGNDLVKNYISRKVKVTGSVQSGTEIDVITVHDFEVVDE